MNFKPRTLKKYSFIFGFGRGAQVGEIFIFGSELKATGEKKQLTCIGKVILSEKSFYISKQKQKRCVIKI